MKAMILAAGLGTRLLPFTLKRPKPLFPVLNRELLHLTLQRMKQANVSETVVNAHHLRQQIKEALQHRPGIILQEEAEILGTGGGLRLALPHFGQEPVLVVNGDIYHSIDYRKVYHAHCDAGADVSLVLHDYPRFNDVAVDETLHVVGFRDAGSSGMAVKKFAFTGIHVINPAVLHLVPQTTPACIIDCYRNLLRQGGTIRAHMVTGHFWTDMGTPADYLKLHGDLLAGHGVLYEDLAGAAAEGPFVGSLKAAIGRGVRLLDWVCLGKNVSIGPGATLQRSVVWAGASVPAGAVFTDAIITP